MVFGVALLKNLLRTCHLAGKVGQEVGFAKRTIYVLLHKVVGRGVAQINHYLTVERLHIHKPHLADFLVVAGLRLALCYGAYQ